MARFAGSRQCLESFVHIRHAALAISAGLIALGGSAPMAGAQQNSGSASPIDHIIVIYLENRSFDNLYGQFPEADGLSQAGDTAVQLDDDGQPYTTLPAPRLNTPVGSDPRAAALPNEPFDISPLVPLDASLGSPTNDFYHDQQQINDGLMNRFAAVSGAGGLVMGHYDGRQLPMWKYAEQYVLADHFFHAAFGGSGLNHYWLVCACTPVWPDPPADLVPQLAPDGTLIRNGTVSSDGYLVNNIPGTAIDQFPLQTLPHIGDRLDAAGVSWAYYAGGWNAGDTGTTPIPLRFFADTAPGTASAALHEKDEDDFVAALTTDDLPAVAFVKPAKNEHPGNREGLLEDDQHVADLVQAIQASPYWGSSAIIVTYDEAGGLWDHVPPPVVDRWGPSARVPAIIISPYAKRGFVDQTVYDTTSILRFIEWRWNLPPLGTRDAAANNLLNAFDFSH